MKFRRGFLLACLIIFSAPVLSQAAESGAICMGLVDAAYPAEVEGFKKSGIIAYQNDCSDYSVAYNFADGDNKLVDTFYMYDTKVDKDLMHHYSDVKAQVSVVHPDAHLISEDSFKFTKNGKEYDVQRAVFNMHDKFFGKDEELYSEVILMGDPQTYILLRSTTPIANKDFAHKKNVDFLNKLNWPDGHISK